MKKCKDPEIHIDVWTLGLIYNLDIKESKVDIKMTFTTPLCPYGPMLVDDIKSKLTEHPDINEAEIEVVFEPPWKPSDELKATLGV